MSISTLPLFLLAVLLSCSAASPFYWKKPCLSQPSLTCYFTPTAGHNVTGSVQFSPLFMRKARSRNRCFVRITAKLNNLSPGYHGFHIHTYGDIRSSDGKSTGGHFSNPSGIARQHALPGDWPRHWGDFGSLEAAGDGTATYDRVDYIIKLRGIVGRGMIVHALEDKGKEAQPSGGAGSRQARCVIGIANPDYMANMS
ncbi:Superoxide dismutase [Cu-Zn] [Gracilariopsis chorda]|uniref:Superoxide dismutase [Cu-Zn] n=1 Tax=Gracilariopsis chorda TaxID=448386 RepID=A0A2V3IQ98_9FLOR|nr:Superoxide dismutase [Cu-Zn] [Gracilariopsis chorda]|eukprot:PXF44234.1 Superoxide dismutase [Cu-Zn] [Gracilariopsis chorda]